MQLARFSASLFLLVGLIIPVAAQDVAPNLTPAGSGLFVPAGTELEIRLRQTLSSYGSKRNTPILAEVISAIVENDQTIVPMKTELRGRVRDVRKIGLGFSRETAVLDLEFNRIKFPGHPEQEIAGKVIRLDDARETVDNEGRIRGIRATNTLGSTLAGVALGVAAVDPMAFLFALTSSLSVFRIPDSSIVLPVGAELLFRLESEVAVPAPFSPQHPSLIDSDAFRTELRKIVEPMPFRTATEGDNEPSDLTSLLYLGSEGAVEGAFLAAGWVKTDTLGIESTYGVMRSIVENQGYRAAPMSVLLLDGQKPTFTFAKTLNTFFSRHHLRIYPQAATFNGKPVWTSTATYDSGIGFSKGAKTFIHIINEHIDEEREKVVDDLVLTGCVDGVGYLDRPWVPTDARNATGDSLLTDGRIAIVDLNTCSDPRRADEPAKDLPEVKENLPAFVRPIRSGLLSLRNDLTRGNIVYQAYSGIKLGLDILKKPDLQTNEPKTLKYGGQEFLIVAGATPPKHADIPINPGHSVEREIEARRPKSYSSRLMFSFNSGLSGYGTPRFTTLPTDLVFTDPSSGFVLRDGLPFESDLQRGWNISPRVTLNSWRHISNEFSYSRTSTNFRVSALDELVGIPIDVRSKAAVRRFSYNTLFHLRPNGSRFRPFVAVGPALQLIHLTESEASTNSLLKFAARDVELFVSAYNFGSKPAVQGGGIFQLGLNYGLGAVFHLTPKLFIRADFRETLSKQPDFWADSPADLKQGIDEGLENATLDVYPLVKHGALRHQVVTMGIGISF